MEDQKGALVLELEAGDGANASCLNLENPEGHPIIVTDVVLHVIVGSGAADTINIGYSAGGGTNDNDYVAAGAIQNDDTVVGNCVVATALLVAEDGFFTATPSADISATDFEAKLYLRYVRV